MSRPEARLFSVGPVLMREKRAVAAGLMLVGAERKGWSPPCSTPQSMAPQRTVTQKCWRRSRSSNVRG